MFTFDEFYEALYSPSGADAKRSPFPWQTRLANHVIANGWVPEVTNSESDECLALDLPTSSGKTTAIDIAVYHLVHQILSGAERTAALRMFFIVDRRIVVDGTFSHARHLADRIASATDGPLRTAAEALRTHLELGRHERPIHVSMMRGGIYRDDGWARSPVQPTICVSTVDQVGSRLLFRGYGVTPSMRPIHAGLVANDSLLLIDEAHLSEPFLQTISRVRQIGSETGIEGTVQKPLQFVRMSATNTQMQANPFALLDEDHEHPVLRRRLEAQKKARMEKVAVDREDSEAADDTFTSKLVEMALTAARVEAGDEDSGTKKTQEKGKTKNYESEAVTPPEQVIGVIVNRVRSARMIYEKLATKLKSQNDTTPPKADVILLTGRTRPFDRDELLFREDVEGKSGWLSWIAADRDAATMRPIIVVATQTVEVGADISFDTLITEAAPLDCLRQRFGRLDRLGHRGQSTAMIVGRNNVVAKTNVDPIYGKAIGETWAWLNKIAAGSGKNKSVDFGLNAMQGHLNGLSPDALAKMLAPKQDAPYLQDKYAELWSRTNPAPAADPEVSIFLHGVDAGLPDVQVIWRCDLLNNGETEFDERFEADYINAVSLVPPMQMEACSVPIWEVQRLLSRDRRSPTRKSMSGDLSDVEGTRGEPSPQPPRRHVLIWRGPEQRTRRNPAGSFVADANRIRPGDTIILPSSFGGCDEFGWNTDSVIPVIDVADSCSRWSRGRASIRIHSAVLAQSDIDIATPDPDDAVALTTFVKELAENYSVPLAIRQSAADLQSWGRAHRWTAPYEFTKLTDDTPSPPFLVCGKQHLEIDRILQESQHTAEDLAGSSVSPVDDDSTSFGAERRVTLEDHTDGVVIHAERFSRLASLLHLQNDFSAAARWHDLGKLDYKFQVMLHNGEELESVVSLQNQRYLAKSDIPWTNRAARRRARERAGVPDGFRHEALSVLLLRTAEDVLENAFDSELVQFLIGSHHGAGRPFFPVCLDSEPRDVEMEWQGRQWQLSGEERKQRELHRIDSDWPMLLTHLTNRYGVWGLAWLEAIFRLADHCQSALDREARDPETEMVANE